MNDITVEDMFIAIAVVVTIAFICAFSFMLGLYAGNYQSPVCVTHMGQVIYVEDIDIYPKSGKASYEYDGKTYYSNQATYWYVEEGQSCE